MAPTETFRQTGLYLVEREGRHCIRRVSQDEDGRLLFSGEQGEVEGYTPDTRLLGKLVGRWQPAPL